MGNNGSTRPARHLAKPGLVSAAVVVLFWQLRSPVIRFSWPFLNYVVGSVLAFGLPWLAAYTIWRLGRRWTNTIAILFGILLIPYSLIVLLGSTMTAASFKDGRD